MSTRARSPLKRNAELKFPIRIRVKVPETGFGSKLEEAHRWLDRELGKGNHAWTGDTVPGHYASAVYLPNVEVAHRLVEQFDLELLYIEDMKMV